LTTLLRPDAGRATVAGHDVVADPGPVRSAIGLAGQYAAVDELLTGRENLELVGFLYQLGKTDRRRRAAEALERLSLSGASDRLVKTYSGGMRRRLDLAASLIGRPPVLFLDEPTTGLDPRTRNDLWDFVAELVAAGTTVLLTTQYMEEAERLANRIVVIDTGRVIAEGTAAELKDRMAGDMLVATVADRADLGRAGAVMASLGEGAPQVDPDQQRVSLPTRGGTEILIAAGQRFARDHIALDDLGIRRPSLDEVFLSLTGNAGRPADSEPRSGHTALALDGAGGRMQTSTNSARVMRVNPRVAIRDAGGIAKRNLLRTIRLPGEASVLIIQPVVILLLFRYVLGGAIKVPGGSYADYLVPAVFVEAMLLAGMSTAIGLAQDLTTGIIDRFRSLPIARSAVLLGRTISDLVRSVFALALVVGVGVAVGFQFHCSFAAALAAIALVIAFGYAFSWIYATIGLLTKNPESAQVIAVLPVFILMFISSAIVPVNSMPGWLQPVARYQPFSVTTDAVRSLLEGGSASASAWQSIAWSAGILVAFFMIAVRLYRKTNSNR